MCGDEDTEYQFDLATRKVTISILLTDKAMSKAGVADAKARTLGLCSGMVEREDRMRYFVEDFWEEAQLEMERRRKAFWGGRDCAMDLQVGTGARLCPAICPLPVFVEYMPGPC